jgi:hypothetical protein
MAETRIWRVSLIDGTRAVDGAAARAGRPGRRSHRRGVRLWALLNAQAVMHGRTGGPHDVSVIEDDRQRLAARRETARGARSAAGG